MYTSCLICKCPRRDAILYRFPASEERLTKWLDALECEDLKKIRTLHPEQMSKLFLCYKHFEKKFVTARSRLKFSAYPSLFTEEEILSGLPSTENLIVEEPNPLLEHCYSRRRHYDHTYSSVILEEVPSELPPSPDPEVNDTVPSETQNLAEPPEDSPPSPDSGYKDVDTRCFTYDHCDFLDDEPFLLDSDSISISDNSSTLSTESDSDEMAVEHNNETTPVSNSEAILITDNVTSLVLSIPEDLIMQLAQQNVNITNEQTPPTIIPKSKQTIAEILENLHTARNLDSLQESVDSYDTFGRLVTAKLREYDSDTLGLVKTGIMNIMVQADMGILPGQRRFQV